MIGACVASVAALVEGCDTPTSAFTPFGTAADVYGEWDVNGRLPSLAVCAEGGIDTVRVVFSPNSTSTERVATAAFTFACAGGFFDSGVEPLLDAGALTYRWQALGAMGQVLLESRPYTIVVQRDVEVVFMPVDFLRREDVTLTTTLRFEGDVGFGSCSTALVDTMSWSLHAGDASGPELAVSGAGTPCAETLVIPESNVLSWSEGPATLVVRGMATDGSAWASSCAVTLPYGGPVTVSCDVPRAP